MTCSWCFFNLIKHSFEQFLYGSLQNQYLRIKSAFAPRKMDDEWKGGLGDRFDLYQVDFPFHSVGISIRNQMFCGYNWYVVRSLYIYLFFIACHIATPYFNRLFIIYAQEQQCGNTPGIFAPPETSRKLNRRWRDAIKLELNRIWVLYLGDGTVFLTSKSMFLTFEHKRDH